jgi:cytidylate kinase
MGATVAAVDGPPGSGLTSVAVELSQLLGWQCISTGLMYRTVALQVASVRASQRTEAARAYATAATFDYEINGGTLRLIANSVDITDSISDPAILPLTSITAQDPALRDILRAHQQALARRSPSVIEGRDTGSCVVPDARWKFYLDAPRDDRYRGLHRIHSAYVPAASPYDDFAKLMDEVETRDQSRLELSRSAPGVIYHLRLKELSAREHAVILYYYIRRPQEITANVAALSET